MNFLAHAYLSFKIPEILVGNLITDFMPGYESAKLPKRVQEGMTLHHTIDTFTDEHPATLKAKEYLRPSSGRYCSVFMDVIYDYFLANDKGIFPNNNHLAIFSKDTYQILDTHYDLLPKKFQTIYHYMKKENWLYDYHTKKGIKYSFGGIFRRAKYLEKNDAVYEAFLSNYHQFQKAYDSFMPEMIKRAKSQIS